MALEHLGLCYLIGLSRHKGILNDAVGLWWSMSIPGFLRRGQTDDADTHWFMADSIIPLFNIDVLLDIKGTWILLLVY